MVAGIAPAGKRLSGTRRSVVPRCPPGATTTGGGKRSSFPAGTADIGPPVSLAQPLARHALARAPNRPALPSVPLESALPGIPEQDSVQSRGWAAPPGGIVAYNGDVQPTLPR